MADLAQLMQFAPTTAGGFMGSNQASQEQSDALKQQELRQLIESRMLEAQQKAAMHPLDLEAKRLSNQQTSAQIPGFAADSELKGINARKAGATYDADVEADITEKKMKAYKLIGTSLGSISGAIDSNPTVPPHAAFTNQLNTMGIPQGVAQRMLEKYRDVPATELSKRLKADAERMLRENAAYVQAMDQEALQQKGATQRQGMTVQGQKDIEQMRIDAGKYNRTTTVKSVEQRLISAKNAKEKAEILESAYYEARTKDPELAAQFLARAQEARQRAAEDERNRGLARPGIDVPAVSGLPASAEPSATAPIAGSGGAPAAKPAPQGARISVVSPDGKRGSIPASQLDQALKQGYKKAQ